VLPAGGLWRDPCPAGKEHISGGYQDVAQFVWRLNLTGGSHLSEHDWSAMHCHATAHTDSAHAGAGGTPLVLRAQNQSVESATDLMPSQSIMLPGVKKKVLRQGGQHTQRKPSQHACQFNALSCSAKFVTGKVLLLTPPAGHV
jgi:hypothetical protein